MTSNNIYREKFQIKGQQVTITYFYVTYKQITTKEDIEKI